MYIIERCARGKMYVYMFECLNVIAKVCYSGLKLSIVPSLDLVKVEAGQVHSGQQFGRDLPSGKTI